MTIKRKITKDEHAKLSDAMKAEYEASGDQFILKLDDDDAAALSRAKDREKERADKLKRESDELRTQLEDTTAKLEEATGNDARKKGDIAALDSQWKAKLEASEKKAAADLAVKNGFIAKSLVDNVAFAAATKISKSPSVLLPHIKNRLSVDLSGDEPKTIVLGKDGKPSDMTVDKLCDEFVANKEFAAIIIGSKASGGAHDTPLHPAAAVPGNPQNQPASLATMDPAMLAASITAKREAQR